MTFRKKALIGLGLLIFLSLVIIYCQRQPHRFLEEENAPFLPATGIGLLIGMEHTSVPDFDDAATADSDYNLDRMEEILEKEDFSDIRSLKSPSATEILDALKSRIYLLQDQDLLVVYYFGHGSQTEDLSGDEEDDMDETLVAYDREIIDDEIFEMLKQANSRARVFFIIDACHSGSSIKLLEDEVNLNHQILFDDSEEPKLSIIYFGATNDNEQIPPDAFTRAIDKEWDRGRFKGTYQEFHEEVLNRAYSESNIRPVLDTSMAQEDFQKERPFQINQ